MGWDAYTKERLTKAEKEEFKKAVARVKRKAGSVDGYLESGGLDCSSCATFLSDATGEEVWTENPWDKEYVKILNKRAIWDKPSRVAKDDLWAYWSAREFLKTCAKLGLRIRFSF